MTTLTLTARLGLSVAQEQLNVQLKQDSQALPSLNDYLINPKVPSQDKLSDDADIDYLAYYLLAKS